MKKVYILFLMAVALLSFKAGATDETSINEPIINDSVATIVDEPVQDAIATDSEPVNDIDTVSSTVKADKLASLGLDDFDLDTFRKYRGADFKFLKNTTNPAVKPYSFLHDQTWVGVPLFVAGMIAKGEKEAFRQNYGNPNTKIRLVKYNFHSEIDNYTQFSGIALTAGLKMAGVEGRSSWPRLFASSLASYGVMAAFVNGIKYTASELRPDGSTRNSWPSGHTATAFVGATILHKEYGLTRSPWYSIGGYTVATATGVMRVLNNRHWISDVLSGAGIGILSTELAYGICDLLFKDKGLLMNDLAYHPDLSVNPSFFSISMGIGLGNKHLTLPGFNFGIDDPGDPNDSPDMDPLELKFRSATAVGVEGAYFFNPYIGIGGRLRVKSTPINGWSQFTDIERKSLKEIAEDPDFQDAITHFDIEIESDHITEFAADAGLYFSLPLSSRFAIGTKLLMKFGTGLSLTYAYKNSFSWRVFCDYDYSQKTYTATYAPFMYIEEFCPRVRQDLIETFRWDPMQEFKSSASKHLHQWVLGGALCISF